MKKISALWIVLLMLLAPSTLHISEIAPRPILFVVGENAHSRAFPRLQRTIP